MPWGGDPLNTEEVIAPGEEYRRVRCLCHAPMVAAGRGQPALPARSRRINAAAGTCASAAVPARGPLGVMRPISLRAGASDVVVDVRISI